MRHSSCWWGTWPGLEARVLPLRATHLQSKTPWPEASECVGCREGASDFRLPELKWRHRGMDCQLREGFREFREEPERQRAEYLQ